MAILGIVTAEHSTLGTYRDANIRRKIFYSYPTGKAPIMGILSRMKSEVTNQETFNWWEKRYVENVTTTASQGSSKGPFQLGAAVDPGLDPFVLTTNGATAVQDAIAVSVASTARLRIGHIVQISGLETGGGTATAEVLRGRITSVTTGKFCMVPLSISTLAHSPGFDNGTTNENVGKEVKVIGSAFASGVTDSAGGIYDYPVNPENYCQISRSPFSFDGRALVSPVRFDDTGIYQDRAKQTSIEHMIELEQTFIFGEKSKAYTAASPAVPSTAVGLPTYTTGGILYFMQLWEAGTTYGNTAATADTDDNKRIIVNTDGYMGLGRWNGYMERLFRGSNATTDEMLCVCGTGFLKTMADMFQGNSVWNYMVPNGDTFGMNLVAYRCSFGTVYFVTHPLFSQNATLRYNGLFLNPNNLVYRYMPERDTQLVNITPTGLDGRTDEWRTDAGLEVHSPEAFMYMQNVTAYAP